MGQQKVKQFPRMDSQLLDFKVISISSSGQREYKWDFLGGFFNLFTKFDGFQT